jgi:CRISPR system Cascade subunit CasA
MTHNLLVDPLIHTNAGALTLPGLFAAMARGEVTDFPALRPHQRPAWHMFLVQLAVLARSGQDGPLPEDEETWRANLRRLTAEFEDDAPWHLVGEDDSMPAFLQPPDPGGVKWSEVATPDALDMLITSRNHDLKREIAHDATPQDWLFALVSLQTMEGYTAKYAGIVRMASGASSRVMLTLAPAIHGTSAIDTSRWWHRDVTILLQNRKDSNGPALLWTLPWPNNSQLSLTNLDPLFIEACRRVRLKGELEKLYALTSTVTKSHIDTDSGTWSDPWGPRKYDDFSALTLGTRDFDFRLIRELIWGKKNEDKIWIRPQLLETEEVEKTHDMLIVAEAFARGKGGKSRTDGFKSRIIPVPKKVIKWMLGDKPIEFSAQQIKTIDDIDHALRDGLRLVFVDGNEKKLTQVSKRMSARNAMDKMIHPARDQFARVADAAFFPALWEKLACSDEDARNAAHNRFVRLLAEAARAEFERAAPTIPCAGIMRPRAMVRGRADFESGIRKIFENFGIKEKEHV